MFDITCYMTLSLDFKLTSADSEKQVPTHSAVQPTIQARYAAYPGPTNAFHGQQYPEQATSHAKKAGPALFGVMINNNNMIVDII